MSRNMTQDDKNVELHNAQEETPQQRAFKKATRLANLAPGEWKLYIDEEAQALGIPVEKYTEIVLDILKDREKKAREAKADIRHEEARAKRRIREQRQQEREDKRARRDEARTRKEADRIAGEEETKRKKREAVFAEIADLPKLTHLTRLKEAAARLGEDFESLAAEFEFYLAARSVPKDMEPWGEKVDTAELLAAIENKFRRYVVVSDAVAAATVLWAAFTHVIEIAVHAPKLVFTFPERDAGKSTALHVLRRMVQRPYMAIEATGAAIYRIVDRMRPTLLLDEADTLFQRSTVLAHIINESWTNGGQKVPRVGPGGEVIEFDPYGTQAIAMKGLNMPGTTLSRCIICTIWPKLPSEAAQDFDECDDEEFTIIRRKLARWSVDNAIALRSAAPESGFNNRTRKNWKVLLAIADLAGHEWPERARIAALELEMDRDEPSEGVRLFTAIRDLIGARAEITSVDMCRALAADLSSEWLNYRRKGPISQAQLAALLRPYGIRPVILHPTKRADLTRHGYRASQFQNAFARLLQKTTKDPNIRTLVPENKAAGRRKPRGPKRKRVRRRK
jgi:Protein of unknown function (DUF3631)